jgi:hypothetical protein
MAISEEVNAFLQDFKAKLWIWGVVFRDDRGKNLQTLLALEITPAYREEVLRELQASDYSEGPKRETLHKGADMWIFGVQINRREVYIKISLGLNGAQVICISFHLSEFPMKYPLK